MVKKKRKENLIAQS